MAHKSQAVIRLDSNWGRETSQQEENWKGGKRKTNNLLLQPMEDLHSNLLNHASLHSRYLSSSDIAKYYPTKVIFPASIKFLQ